MKGGDAGDPWRLLSLDVPAVAAAVCVTEREAEEASCWHRSLHSDQRIRRRHVEMQHADPRIATNHDRVLGTHKPL